MHSVMIFFSSHQYSSTKYFSMESHTIRDFVLDKRTASEFVVLVTWPFEGLSQTVG